VLSKAVLKLVSPNWQVQSGRAENWSYRDLEQKIFSDFWSLRFLNFEYQISSHIAVTFTPTVVTTQGTFNSMVLLLQYSISSSLFLHVI